MKYFLILNLILLPFCTYSQKTVYYTNGQIASKGLLLPVVGHPSDNTKVGTWYYYYPNGKTWLTGEFVADIPYGLFEFYYPNGIKAAEVYFSPFENIPNNTNWRNDRYKIETAAFSNFVRPKNHQIEWAKYYWRENNEIAKKIERNISTDGDFIDFESEYPFKLWVKENTNSGYEEGNMVLDKIYQKSWMSIITLIDIQLETIELYLNDDTYQEFAKANNEALIPKAKRIKEVQKIEESLLKLESFEKNNNSSIVEFGARITRKIGKWLVYRENNTLYSDCNYAINGKADCIFYYEDGTIQQINSINEFSEIDGNYQHFYDNGKLRDKGTFTNGTKVGEWKWYHENGKIKTIENLILDDNGKPVRDGEMKQYDETGSLLYKTTFNNKNSSFIIQGYFENGNIKQVEQYQVDKNGKRNRIGVWKWYHKNGNLKNSAIYQTNENVTLKTFDSNGNLISTEVYVNGVKQK